MFRHPDPEVLVVGAGPVGLVAALFLCSDRRCAEGEQTAKKRTSRLLGHFLRLEI